MINAQQASLTTLYTVHCLSTRVRLQSHNRMRSWEDAVTAAIALRDSFIASLQRCRVDAKQCLYGAAHCAETSLSSKLTSA